MTRQKQLVLITGASGSMGFETFRLLWEKRDQYDMVLLLRPSRQNRKKFRKYIREASRSGGSGSSLRIVWGDVLNKKDVVEACRGIDWCLHHMALISPAADRQPEMAELVNSRGTRYLVEAIEAENPEHIRLVNISTVAVYGNRLPPLHVARTGDPVIPSVFDHYSMTKIAGELLVMQSRIRHRVSLRQTFIMIPEILSLTDSIMFHQPLNSFLEGITAHDSGRLMVNCLEIPDDSGFWGQYFNISGGPACRTTFLELLDRIYSLVGIRYDRVMERKWFALKNFHTMHFEDSGRLDGYLDHWKGVQSLEDYYKEIWKAFPWYLKTTAWHARYIPLYRSLVEAITRAQLKKLAFKKDGTLHWIRSGDEERIRAFYGSLEDYRRIPDWGTDMPYLEHDQPYRRLQHGYDETREKPAIRDLQQAAGFRGGKLITDKPEFDWERDKHKALEWTCCQDHSFSMTPHAVLKGGHWCMDCIAPPWNYGILAEKNPFAAQVLNP